MTPTNPRPLVIAYRGGSGERPENTLSAFDHAVSISTDILLEIDLRRTRDGVLVAMHDDTVERTTDGRGRVADLTLPELKKLDAAFHFKDANGVGSFRNNGIGIPTLEEILSRYSNNRLVLDLHESTGEAVRELLARIDKAGARQRVVFASDQGEAVRRLRADAQDCPCCATARELWARLAMQKLRLGVLAPRIPGILMVPETQGRLRVLSPSFVALAHSRDERVWAWMANQTSDAKRMAALGVDGMFTPWPALIHSQDASLAA